MSPPPEPVQGDTRIVTRCPSCGHSSLFIGTGGHLTCSWLECKNPSVSHAIEQLTGRLSAMEQERQVEFERAERAENGRFAAELKLAGCQAQATQEGFEAGYRAGLGPYRGYEAEWRSYQQQLSPSTEETRS